MTQPNEPEPMMKYNERIQGIRDRLGKTDERIQTPEQEGQKEEPVSDESNAPKFGPVVTDHMQKFYGRLLIENKPTSSKDIAQNVGIPEGMVYDVTKALLQSNLVIAETLPKRGSPKVFSINTETPLPEGWPSADDLKKSVPLLNLPKDSFQDEADKIASARDNPLTKMLLNEGKKVFDTKGYEEFINDTKKTYGIKELDDVIDILHKICKERIVNKRIECPICHGKMDREGSELRCKKCN